MRVLLLHEMSGVHTELRRGLRALGVDARIATFGDNFKRYRTDIVLGRAGTGAAAAASKLYRQVLQAGGFRRFDIVQTISPDPFFRPLAPLLEPWVFSDPGKCVYVAAGSDAVYRHHVQELRYQPPHDWFDDPVRYRRMRRWVRRFGHVVPVCWEYRHAMLQAGVPATPVMPFPVDLSRHPVKPPSRSGKLRFFHPLNRIDLRHDFKGTLLIRAAFDRLRERHGDVAEFTCAGGMDHAAYDALTNDVDVIVDQAYSYSYGMSAAYGMAKGKVVLSGLETEARGHGFYRDCPVVNLLPDVDSIVAAIEPLILDRAATTARGEASRAFAEQHHDHLRVAEAYLEMYRRDPAAMVPATAGAAA